MKRCLVTFAVMAAAANPAFAERLELEVADAYPIITPEGAPAVEIRFDAAGTRAFAAFTRERVGKPAELYVDEERMLAATILDPILDGQVMISNVPDAEQAILLAMLLRAGEAQVSVADPE